MQNTLPSTAADFIRAIHPHAEPKWFFHARCISLSKNKTEFRSVSLNSLDDLNIFSSDHNGAGHIFANLALTTMPLNGFPKTQDLNVWDCLFFDIDLATPEKPHRPGSTDEALAGIQALPIVPTAIINTGSGGLGVFYSLNAARILKTNEDRLYRDDIAIGFANYINWQLGSLFGWQKFDSVSDLARVHRIIKTTNVKPGIMAECLPLLVTGATHDLRVIEELIASIPSASNDNDAPQGRRCCSSVEPMLEAMDREWFDEAFENKGRRRSTQPLAPNPAAIYAGCAFIRHTHENAATLPEPEWHAMISVLASSKDGEKVVHALSKGHPGYDEHATDKKIREAQRAAKPSGCSAIGQLFPGCKTCPFSTANSNPITLGYRSKHHVELLADHIYIQQTQSILDFAHGDRVGVSPKQFAEYHSNRRLLGTPDKVFLNDELCRKAKERTYRPDLPFGMLNDEGKTIFNTYQAPTHINGRQEDAEKFTQHLEYLIPDHAEREHLLKYFAHLVQKPWVKITSAIAIVGPQGTGKSLLLNLMREVLGASNVNVSKGSSLKSNFNGQLAGHVLLGLEEVSIEGRAETYEHIKALITNETDDFEYKFRNREELPTPRGIMLLMNDKFGLWLPDRSERRFSVLTATNQKRSAEYYRALFDFTPEFVAGVYAFLMNIDLSGFNPKAAPISTAAKDKMALNSKSEVELAVADIMEDSAIIFEHDIQKWTDLQEAVNARLTHPSTAKPIQRALETYGCVSSGKQCPLKDGSKVRLWFVRNAEKYAGLTRAELAKAYHDQFKTPFNRVA